MLTEERAKALLDAVKTGAPLDTCAAFAGITREALRKYRRRGEKALEIAAGRRSPTERRMASFVGELDRALSEAAIRAQATVRQLMVLPDGADAATKRVALEASKFHLTHRDPRNYSTQIRAEVTGADGGAVEVDVSTDAAIDLLIPFLRERGIEVVDDGDEGEDE